MTMKPPLDKRPGKGHPGTRETPWTWPDVVILLALSAATGVAVGCVVFVACIAYSVAHP